MSIINQWVNRYILAGRETTADNAPTNEVVVDANGAMKTSLSGSTLTNAQRLPTYLTTGAGAEPFMGGLGNNDSNVPTMNMIGVYAQMAAYNDGVNQFQRWRNNTEGTLLANAARTATTNSPYQTNYNSTGVIVYLNVTAVPAAPGTGGLRVLIVVVDPVSGQVVQLNSPPSVITTTGIYAVEVSPGASGTSGAGSYSVLQRTSGRLSRTWYASVQPADAQSYAYSVGYALTV